MQMAPLLADLKQVRAVSRYNLPIPARMISNSVASQAILLQSLVTPRLLKAVATAVLLYLETVQSEMLVENH